MIEVFKGEDGWRYHVLGDNGEVMCTSEAYSDKSNAIRGAEDLKLLFEHSVVVQHTMGIDASEPE